jgi:hypothetical protein
VAQLPILLSNVTIGVDARLVGPTERRYVAVGCRAGSGGGPGFYRLSVAPDRGAFSLDRQDAAGIVTLTRGSDVPAIRRGNESNRLELTCLGATITAAVNGSEIASVQDATYTDGWLGLNTGNLPDVTGPTEARFDNLTVVAR